MTKKLQKIHDLYIQSDRNFNIREIGYGDVSINKNMKKYVNFFYDILSKIDKWEEYNSSQKSDILNKIIKIQKIYHFLQIILIN